MARRASRLEVVQAPARSGLERLCDDYLAHVGARGLSRKTVAIYDLALRRILLPWAEREGVTEGAQLDQRALDRLSTELLDVGGPQGPLSRGSVRTYLSSIGHMLSWARTQGEAGEAKPQLPRLERQVIVTLDRDEVRRIEDAAGNERDKLVVRLLADTGMRAGELAKLELDDLVEQGRDRFLRVRGKGRRQRLVPLQPALYSRVRRYATKTRPQDANSSRIFVSLRRSRRTGSYEPLEVSGVGQLVRELGHKAGIRKRVHAHGLRHQFVTWALRRGMNPLVVATIVGHEDLTMIQRTYSHLNQQDAAKAMMELLRSEAE
jgi:integrase/recombinase XerD